MKKILISILLCISLVAASAPLMLIYAAGERQAPTVENILPTSVTKSTEGGKGIVSGNFKEQVVPTAIKMFLGLMGTFSFVLFVYAGVNLIVSQGNEEEIGKFKKMLMWSVVGLIFILGSYGIVDGVARLLSNA